MTAIPHNHGLDSLLSHLGKTRPNATAIGLTDGRRLFSFHELNANIDGFANSLLAAGIRPGEMLALVMPNSLEFIVAFLAITKIRAIAAPLNPDYQQKEFDYFIEDQGAIAVLDIPGSRANIKARKAANTLGKPVWEALWSGDKVDFSLSGGAPIGDPVQLTPVEPEQDVALFLHTSGTTSRPKGVPLTHQNIMTSLRNIAETYEFGAQDRSVLVMPLFHVHGLMAGLLAPLASGASVYIQPSGKFSASAFWPDMTRWHATWYTAVPAIHQILLARHAEDYPAANPPKLRFIRSCSAPLAPSILDEMEKKFQAPVLEAYAMTEAAHQMASNPLPKNGPRKPGSVGQGQQVRIAILDERLNVLKPRQEGEIVIQGENVTKGYRNNPEANEAAFAGGWFHTGDLGYLDEEGYLFITGRIKELINRGGEKISPLRIDDVLLTHPCVAEAVAFAVPDPKYGEEVNAAVILKPGATATAGDITEFCLKALAAFAVPKRIFFAENFPKTGSGKIQRKQIAEHFLAGK